MEIGKPVEFDSSNLQEMKRTYIELIKLLGSDYELDRLERMIQWLDTTDFFIAPASTKYHDAFDGGLLYHHLNVYNQMCDLLETRKFHDKVSVESAALVSLTHDFCKIGLYEKYLKNVKNDETGRWVQVPAYRWVDGGAKFPLGHGVSSIYLLSQFIRLDLSEWLAIRWHMGEYNCCQNEMSELQNARDQYPLVLLIQTADRLASTTY